MPALLTSAPPRKLWNRDECLALESAGILEAERFELVEGELFDTMSKNQPHTVAIVFVVALLQRIFGIRFVSFEGSIDVAPEDNPSSEPQPDVLVLNRDLSQFRNSRPKPEDIRLVIEVSARRLLAHRHPINGKYESILVYGKNAYGENESVAPFAAPQAQLRIAEIFA